MQYRNLGRTGVKVSPLCLGTMNFAHRTPEDEAGRILDRAIEAGINFIDTANFYGQPLNDGTGQGYTEELLGRYFKAHGGRERIVLATKFWAPMDRDDPNARGGSRRHIIQQCEQSLRRLQTDHIDLYQMHRPDLQIPIDETLRALDDLIRAGKVHYIGGSGFSAWRIVESIWTSRQLRLNRFVSEQAKYNLLHRKIEGEVLEVAQHYDVAILAYQPLASGVLTGKYARGEDFPAGSRLADPAWGPHYAQSYLTDKAFALIDTLREMAAEKDRTISQLALAWVAAQPGVASVIIGPRTLEQLEDNLGALEVALSEDELAQIERIAT